MAYLEVENLAKSFKGRPVLQAASFGLEHGEILVILGNSGSGKTTLLRMLCFLETPDAGKITLSGQELYSASLKLNEEDKAARRAHFGLVFQGFHLFPQYDVHDNVMLPLKLQSQKALKAQVASLGFIARKEAYRKAWQGIEEANEKKVAALLEEFHLNKIAKDFPYSLSGGESQRVALARALALNPEILCFDEPTSALDPRLKLEVADLLKKLKASGRTLIVVTHEIAFAAAIADRIVFLEDGMIVEQGDSRLLQTPTSPELREFLSQGEKEDNDERRSQDQKTGA
jgi:polar amino acid transport system ATP-binding protein